MKIALVSPVMVPVPPPKYGGIQLIVAEVAEGLAQRGHQVTIFCSGESTISGKNITRVDSSPFATKNFPEKIDFGKNVKWKKLLDDNRSLILFICIMNPRFVNLWIMIKGLIFHI